jgi:hypothetical protein
MQRANVLQSAQVKEYKTGIHLFRDQLSAGSQTTPLTQYPRCDNVSHGGGNRCVWSDGGMVISRETEELEEDLRQRNFVCQKSEVTGE